MIYHFGGFSAQLALLTGARVQGTWALAAIVVLAAACGGGSERAAVARPQVVRVGTTEIDGDSGIGFRLEIRRLVITGQGWRVEARVTNSTATIWTIGRPHVPEGTKFGLFVAATVRELQATRLEASGRTTPPLIANSFAPPVPRLLRPGDSWSGSFAGTGEIPAGSFVCVAFGRFSTDTPPPGFPDRLMAITSAPIRLM